MSQLGKSPKHLLASISHQLRQINGQLARSIPTKILKPGDGINFPSDGDTVRVKYIGRLPNGSVFDKSSLGNPFTFTLNRHQVIKGWDQVVSKMSLGERVRVKILPALAYGSKGTGGGRIPPNTTLTFTMKLLSIN